MKRIVVLALVLNAALLGVIAHQLVAIAGGGAVPTADRNGDVNGDARLDMSDAIYLLLHIFRNGPEPVALADSPEVLDRLDNLERAVADCCDRSPSSVDLRYMDLPSTFMMDANLEGVNFTGSVLPVSVMVRANLRNTNLQNTDLRGVRFQDADLTGANLMGQILRVQPYGTRICRMRT